MLPHLTWSKPPSLVGRELLAMRRSGLGALDRDVVLAVVALVQARRTDRVRGVPAGVVVERHIHGHAGRALGQGQRRVGRGVELPPRAAVGADEQGTGLRRT